MISLEDPMKKIEVKVEEGILAGEEKTTRMIFRGVPYAEAPVGQLRFRAPVPKHPWKGVRDAVEFGPICPQPDPTSGFYGREFYTDPSFPVPAQNEDCLYLNIWAPLAKKPGGYPVAFWIHGGAFDHGWGSEMEFDGDAFTSQDTILVTINYRVGVFGFFAHPDLHTDGIGNAGILDQILALRWVVKNIAAFGGDPDRITVFGQSAGAMSVQALVCSPLTEGLIHGAVMQSGAGYDNGLGRKILPEDAYRTSGIIMELLKVSTLDEMVRVPAEKFVEILPALYEKTGGLAFGPVIDGTVVTQDYDQAAENGTIQDLPYMIGMTENDITVEEGEDARNSRFYKGIIDWAKLRLKNSRKPVYVYYFRRKLPGDDAGAFHSSELWYVFGTLGRCWRPMTPHDYKLSSAVIEYWTSFMKNDDPGKGWKPYTEEEQFVRSFM